jgi:hypothetical protein
MANPTIHSESSVKRWGGKVEDYIAIHKLIDSPKVCMNNNTARMLTHNIWFCYEIIPLIFGDSIINSRGKRIDTVDIAMLHLAEDFRHKFIPTVQDYLKHMEVQAWMNNGVKDIENDEAKNYINLLNLKLNEYVRSNKAMERTWYRKLYDGIFLRWR